MENINRIGFDNEKYLQEQSKAILERVNQFDGKLYSNLAVKSYTIIMLHACFPGLRPMSRCSCCKA